MKSLADTFTLSNGAAIPCVGFGTWQTPAGEVGVNAVKAALAAGYRHIDTAAVYGNEASVGQALRESGIPREEIFVTTKLWNSDRGFEQTMKAFELSLNNLGLDHLDLYLIHWPNPVQYRDRWQRANAESWGAMEELYRRGKIKAIGVSNFWPHHLEALLEQCTVKPMVNQIRLFPGNEQADVVAYCRQQGILLEAYSPFGTGSIFNAPELKTIAAKYGRPMAQICIRWSLQKGFVPLPKSVTPERIRENAAVFDFEISGDDMQALSEMQNYCGEGHHPDQVSF